MRTLLLPAILAFASVRTFGGQTSGSQNIDQVVGQALRSNPSVLSARQRVQEAQSHVLEVAGQGRFQLVFNGLLSGSYGRVAEPPSIQSFGTAEGSLNLALPNRRRNIALLDQAQALLEVARAELRRTELDIEFRSSQGFIEVIRAREALTIAQENLAQADRQVADTKKRIDAGDVPAADLLRVQVPQAQNRAAAVRAQNARRVAEQNLNSLLQVNLLDPLNLAAPTPPTIDLTSDQAVATAEQNSPDVLEALANVRAADANLRAVRRTRDADWSVVATHSRTTDITAYSHVSTLALNLSLPLADGGVARHQVRQAQLQLAQANSALILARQDVALTTQQLLLEVQGDQANVEANQTTLRIAQESLAKARLAYAAGLTTTRDVLDAQLVYAQARVEANAAVYDLLVAYAHLRQVLGGTRP